MKKILIIIILFLLIISSSKQVFASNQPAIDSGISYLKSQQLKDGNIDGFSGVTDWAAMAFSADNLDINTIASTSGQTLLSFLKSDTLTNSSSSNDWSRRILMATAANQNPYDFSGTNLVAGLETYYNNNQIGSTTADNDDMFALLALLASKVDITNSIITDVTSFIISHQHSDGGFSYSTDPSTGSDIDDTAAAIMALNFAKLQNVNVNNLQSSINSAKTYILSNQNSDGGFAYDPNPSTSWDTTSNVSTTSWVVMAFSSLGLDGTQEFSNAQDYIISTQESDGSFPYQPIYPPGDTFDSSYALLALENVFWPIHVFSGTVPTFTVTSAPTPTLTLTLTPTPMDMPSSNSNDSDPTQTPTPTVTPTPTIPATQTPTASDSYQATDLLTNTPTLSPSPTVFQQVLGTQTSIGDGNKNSLNIKLMFALVFFGLGIASSGFYVFKKIKKI